MESYRTKGLDELSQFISDSKVRVGNILKALNWEEKSTLQEKCLCKVSKRNESGLFKIALSKYSVTLDSNELQNVLKIVSHGLNSEIRKEIPSTFGDLRSFTRDEKLAIYDHCIERTGRLSEPEISVMLEGAEGMQQQMSFAQIVAQKRDLKRRSLKYRTNKEPPLSQTEEIRTLIELQMRALSQYLSSKIDQKNEINGYKKHKEDLAISSKTKRSRSVSRSSKFHRSRDYRKNRDCSGQCDKKKLIKSRISRSRSLSKKNKRMVMN